VNATVLFLTYLFPLSINTVITFYLRGTREVMSAERNVALGLYNKVAFLLGTLPLGQHHANAVPVQNVPHSALLPGEGHYAWSDRKAHMNYVIYNLLIIKIYNG